MEKYNKIIGNSGEDLAEAFLRKKGYKIIERNYSSKFGEIDIVGLDKNCLVFVEVKTRTTSRYGAPSNAVDYHKRRHIELTAKNYIEHRRMGEYFARFDVVEVFAKYADNKLVVEKINLLENVFFIT